MIKKFLPFLLLTIFFISCLCLPSSAESLSDTPSLLDDSVNSRSYLYTLSPITDGKYPVNPLVEAYFIVYDKNFNVINNCFQLEITSTVSSVPGEYRVQSLDDKWYTYNITDKNYIYFVSLSQSQFDLLSDFGTFKHNSRVPYSLSSDVKYYVNSNIPLPNGTVENISGTAYIYDESSREYIPHTFDRMTLGYQYYGISPGRDYYLITFYMSDGSMRWNIDTRNNTTDYIIFDSTYSFSESPSIDWCLNSAFNTTLVFDEPADGSELGTFISNVLIGLFDSLDKCYIYYGVSLLDCVKVFVGILIVRFVLKAYAGG